MRSIRPVLAGAMAVVLATHGAHAEDLTSGRQQMGRGTSSRVAFDRNNLSVGQLRLSGNEKGSQIVNGRPSDLPAADMLILEQALQRIRDLNKKGYRTNNDIENGDPTKVPPVQGLTAEEKRVLAIFKIPSQESYARASSAIIMPNVHQQPYYAFDIDRILNSESQLIPHGLLGEPDVLVPVREVHYERIVSTAKEGGLVGGWTVRPGDPNAVEEAHYQVPIPRYAVKSDGTLAHDPQVAGNPVVPLQLLGPGNWYSTRPENLPPQYSFNPANSTFRVAMGISPDDSTPDPFVTGGHIACYWIYDFANPPNCHSCARSGDPVSIGPGQGDGNPAAGYGQYGTTVVVSVNNGGQDN